MRSYYVYILTNTWNTVLYTGMTSDISRRTEEHRGKIVLSFTERYHLWKVVYVEVFSNPTEAAEAEWRIKKWSRRKKRILVESRNPEWRDLARILE